MAMAPIAIGAIHFIIKTIILKIIGLTLQDKLLSSINFERPKYQPVKITINKAPKVNKTLAET